MLSKHRYTSAREREKKGYLWLWCLQGYRWVNVRAVQWAGVCLMRAEVISTYLLFFVLSRSHLGAICKKGLLTSWLQTLIKSSPLSSLAHIFFIFVLHVRRHHGELLPACAKVKGHCVRVCVCVCVRVWIKFSQQEAVNDPFPSFMGNWLKQKHMVVE